jgi:hypothetical protein
MVYRVFLSSTSKDLAAHREAAERAILSLDGFAPIAMENFGARDTNARGIDEQKLREADLLVGLMGTATAARRPTTRSRSPSRNMISRFATNCRGLCSLLPTISQCPLT